MNAYTTYRYILNSPLTGSELIDQKAIERECSITDNHRILCSKAGDTTLTNWAGNEVTTGHRVHEASGKIVEFIVENSYKKDQRDRELTVKHILND